MTHPSCWQRPPGCSVLGCCRWALVACMYWNGDLLINLVPVLGTALDLVSAISLKSG